jgi:metal-sulfur cluster biosynthetic enzyme
LTQSPGGAQRREERVWKRLDKVIDPHTDISVVAMKLVTGVDLSPAGGKFAVTIHFRPDTPACPVLDELKSRMKHAIERFRWVESADVIVTIPGGGPANG